LWRQWQSLVHGNVNKIIVPFVAPLPSSCTMWFLPRLLLLYWREDRGSGFAWYVLDRVSGCWFFISFFLSLCCLHSGRLSVVGFTEQRNGERVPGCISGCRSRSQQLCCIQAFRQYSLTGLVAISSPVAQHLLHHPSFFPTSVLHMCGTSQTTIQQQDCG
jgi:hypothetical protein